MTEVETPNQWDYEEKTVVEIGEWDINDPAIAAYAVPIDTEEVPRQQRPAPPSDGIHLVRFRLGTRKDGGDPVYIKGPKGQPAEMKVVATLKGRVVDRETDEEKAFIKMWWPTSQVFRGSKGSQLTAIYFLTTGKPIPASNPRLGVTLPDIKNAIDTLFAEREYVDLWVQTRWDKSVPKTEPVFDSDGNQTELLTYVYDANGKQEYESVKGEARIKKLMALQGVPAEQAHIWYDPVSGEERSVDAEVVTLKDSSKFDFGG